MSAEHVRESANLCRKEERNGWTNKRGGGRMLLKLKKTEVLESNNYKGEDRKGGKAMD
jgi:hypothetical protein